MPPLVHHSDYDALTVPDGHRFPMRKYSILADQLRAGGAVFVSPKPASAAALERAHDPVYVTAVLGQAVDRATALRIGFPVTGAIAQRSAASCGGTLLAARLALEAGAAVNLAGGSHHADRAGGAGFCVFNDVAVAALALLADGSIRRIAVIDCDVHQGDGTARIFAAEPRVFTFSIHCEANWPHEKAVSDLDIGLRKGAGDRAYLAALERALPRVFDRARPDLVFYNAGVDPHADDRLGLLSLTDEGLAARDAMVAAACRSRGVPVCGVLGGGYGKDAAAVAARHRILVRALGAG